MTRFERELNGSLGAYWQAQAQKELEPPIYRLARKVVEKLKLFG